MSGVPGGGGRCARVVDACSWGRVVSLRSCIMNVRCGLPYVAIVHAIAGWIIPAWLAGAAIVRCRGFFFCALPF